METTPERKVKLRGQGLSATRPRLELLHILENDPRPQSIEEIISSSAGRLALSTLYRAISELLDAGLIETLVSPDGKTLVETTLQTTAHHHHVFCKGCDKAIDIEFSEDLEKKIDAEVRNIEISNGWKVSDHSVEILGICGECKAR
jgi:Fur family ferric uptake transcriptional regulator|tara:strand:+ start:948 stop:1385 length:438 start_codon:yes stop_codon:yes gene_type:complete